MASKTAAATSVKQKVIVGVAILAIIVGGLGILSAIGRSKGYGFGYPLIKKTNANSSKYVRVTPGYEPIVFALNKSYADKMPDWQARANEMINRVNKVFLKTTQKKYKISKFMIYDDLDYEKTWYDPEFHLKSNDVGTTTIISLVLKNDITDEEFKKISPSNMGNVGFDGLIDGVSYHNVILNEREKINILLTKEGDLPQYTLYEPLISLPLHELGHASGLGSPDWYLYSYEDCTKTTPILPDYDIKNIYPKDPMTGSGLAEFEFCEMNSKIINMNLNHLYGFMDINNWVTKVSKVYVTDSHDNPIKNVRVKIFCVRKNCYNCTSMCNNNSGVVNSSVPEQILYTDASGYAEYIGPSGKTDFTENENTGCLAKAIKVYYQGKSNAKYVRYLDLQEDYIMYNKQVHIDHIVIE